MLDKLRLLIDNPITYIAYITSETDLLTKMNVAAYDRFPIKKIKLFKIIRRIVIKIITNFFRSNVLSVKVFLIKSLNIRNKIE